MSEEVPGPLIGSTPEPNCSGERIDICRLTTWTRDGTGSILTLQGEGGDASTALQVRVEEVGPWWVGAHYRISISVEPFKDPISDKMNEDAIHLAAIQMGIARLLASGKDALEFYRVVGGAIAPSDKDYSTFETEAHKADCHVRWLKHVFEGGNNARIAFLCLRSEITDEELRSLID